MPFGKNGKFALNTQRALASDKQSAKPKPKPMPAMPAAAPPMGDEMEQAPAGGEESLASMHEPGGKHMHISGNGMGGFTSSQSSDGAVDGPHDHDNLEMLKQSMDQFFTEEEQEGAQDAAQDQAQKPQALY